jgi:hypothetical protein
MSLFSNTNWHIIGNGFSRGFDNQRQSQPIHYIRTSLGWHSNHRKPNLLYQAGQGISAMWSGTPVPVGGGGVNSIWSIMGMFTHREGTQQSGPFLGAVSPN